MKSAIKVITFADLTFILCLIFSGACEGIISEILYYFAYALPILMLFSFIGSSKAEAAQISLSISKEKIKSALLLIFPAVAITALVAYLTSLLMGAFGFSPTAITGEPIYLALVTHALLPALLEEILFRYLPIKIMSPYSKRLAILLSAAAFSLCHTNLFQIPYAFLAGLLLGYVTIHSGSIIPAFVIHFINNALSVTTMLYPDLSLWIFISLGSLALISVFFIVQRRACYKDIADIFKRGEDEELSFAPIALIALSLFIAITALIK